MCWLSGFCSDGNCEGENGEVKVEQKKEGMLFTKQLQSQAAREKVCTREFTDQWEQIE